MTVEDTKVICISRDRLLDNIPTGVPYINCLDDNELINAINRYKQYSIIFICNAGDVKRLYRIISSRKVREVFIFGQCIIPDIKENPITIVEKDQLKLLLLILCSVQNYINEEEVKLRQIGENRMADERTMDICQLLKQMRTLYFTKK